MLQFLATKDNASAGIIIVQTSRAIPAAVSAEGVVAVRGKFAGMLPGGVFVVCVVSVFGADGVVELRFTT